MANYAEYLKAQGATDEDIKILDTPVAQRAYAKMQADADERLKTSAAEWDRKTTEWYTGQIVPSQEKLQRERDTAMAEAAAEKARVKALQEQGLLEVAAQQEPAKQDTGASAVDLSKYVTSDTLMQVAEREGDAIAIAQDIAFEHKQLFPDKPLNFRELRKEAVAKKQSLEQLWMDKYQVSAARQAAQDAALKSREDAIRAEERKAVTSELASKYGNPDARPLVSSRNPFTNAPPSAGQDAGNGQRRQPWDRPETQQQSERLAKVLKNHPEVLQ